MNRNTVRVCRIVALMALAVVMVAQAFGQGQLRMTTPQTPVEPYSVAYFTNNTAAAPDAQLRFTNDGENGAPPANMTANIYVFDTTQEMLECCCAEVSANGYLALDVFNDLTSKPLTGPQPPRGIIKVVSSAGVAKCDPSSAYTALGGIRGWITHIQAAGAGAFSITESDLEDSDLGAGELTYLQTTCAFVLTEGSGLAGACSVADSGQ